MDHGLLLIKADMVMRFSGKRFLFTALYRYLSVYYVENFNFALPFSYVKEIIYTT
jgi:hypothetical protein